MSKYVRFIVMIATSMVAMYAITYLNSYALGHVYFSETRFFMTLLMGATMAVVMMVFMMGMYNRPALNRLILIGSVAIFGLSLFLVRSQTTVDDVSWMKAMIPHHSIAILTSERANISDPRVAELASRIIEAQNAEIAEMRQLIADLEGK